MNPVRSFGPSFVSLDALINHAEVYEGNSLYYDTYWQDHWVYWAGPTIGTLLATYMYKYIMAARNTVPEAPPQAPTHLKPSLKQMGRRQSIPAGLVRKVSVQVEPPGPVLSVPHAQRRRASGSSRRSSVFTGLGQ